MPPTFTDKGVQRRIINFSGFRLDGLADILPRANGATVFDVGCNRGAVCHDLVLAGAKLVHGCDNYADGMKTANEWFADIRSVSARFEVVDLTGGGTAIEKAFGKNLLDQYDIIVFLAIYHKLWRVMSPNDLRNLLVWLVDRCGKFFVWRGSREERDEIHPILESKGFRMVHYSEICEVELPQFHNPVPQPAAIWSRGERFDYEAARTARMIGFPLMVAASHMFEMFSKMVMI